MKICGPDGGRPGKGEMKICEQKAGGDLHAGEHQWSRMKHRVVSTWHILIHEAIGRFDREAFARSRR